MACFCFFLFYSNHKDAKLTCVEHAGYAFELSSDWTTEHRYNAEGVFSSFIALFYCLSLFTSSLSRPLVLLFCSHKVQCASS